jgi:capsular exopolysaccharide synthesis family protein
MAILLDRLDGKFRYPNQAGDELGLAIAGAVPQLPAKGLAKASPEQVVQVLESFRSLRMHVLHTVPGRKAIAVTSAAPGDGKSLVSANLAMSFAEAGMRTLIVDGDTRRGNLHDTFGAVSSPGLTEFLVGSASISNIIQSTSNENLFVLACGRRNARSPELLSTDRLVKLVAELQNAFDVVIFDTPPFAAGIDGYAIAAAAGNLLMVVRIGKTIRRHAAAKLGIADRLPINMIGAVLNGAQLNGDFEYYGYTPGYSIEEPRAELAASSSG